jgi:carbon-monoxide dehydrogenase medium subunit
LPLAALVLDAEIEIWSAAGKRTLPAREFFVSIFTTVINPDELIVAVHVPVTRDGWGFRLFNRRAGDFAIVSVAATLRRADDATIQGLRLAIGGIGPIPLRVETLVARGIAGRMSKDWSASIAAAVADAVEIEDNERTPVNFRRELVAALTEDALDQALDNAR